MSGPTRTIDREAYSIKASPLRSLRSEHAMVATALFLAIFSVWLSYPGIMSWDSTHQYEQAMTGAVNDWFPPVMARLWQVFLPVSKGGSAFLALHMLGYWLSLLLVALPLQRAGMVRLAWAALLSGVLPHTLLLSTFIHNDVGHAVAITTAFGLILWRRSTSGGLGWPAAAVVTALLAYATLVRANGAFGAAPVALFAVAPKIAIARRRLIIGTALSIIIVLLAIPINSVMNSFVFGAVKTNQIVSLVHYDLAGISQKSHDASVWPERQPSIQTIDRCYDARMWDALGLRDDCKTEVGVNNGVKNRVKTLAWPAAIIKHPIAYAQHRLSHFNEELFAFIGPREWIWPPYSNAIVDPVPVGRIQHFTETALDALANSPPFAPVTSYVAALVVLGLLAWRRRLESVWLQGAFFLGLAGVLYSTAYLIVGVASMYRYQQFGMTAAIVSFILLLAGWERERWAFVAKAVVFPTAATAVLVGVARVTLP